MVSPLTLFTLFGDFTANWPRNFIGPELGIDPTSPDYSTWLTILSESTMLADVRSATTSGHIAIEAKAGIINNAVYPTGIPFVLTAMPDVEFRIQSVSIDTPVRLFVSQEEVGITAVVEGLPVEIRLPPGMISPHPDASASSLSPTGGLRTGKFISGVLDTQEIAYEAEGPSSIFVHVRIIVNVNGDAIIRPTVPISFGRCKFLDVPCLGVHDFQLVPSPANGAQDLDWPRHSLEPWKFQAPTPVSGFFAVRSIDLDPAQDPIKGLVDFLSNNGEREKTASFVIDDVAVPFFSEYLLPIPRHITIGVRRDVIDPHDPKQVFSFENAPIHIKLNKAPITELIVESIFFRSPSAADVEKGDIGLSFKAMIGIDGRTGPIPPEPGSTDHAVTIELAENMTLRAGLRRNLNQPENLRNPGGSALYQTLHWEIGDVHVNIVGFQFGYSLGRAIGEEKGFFDSAEALFDIFVQMPPTGEDTSCFKMRSLNGETVAFAMKGIGWKQGSPHFEGAVMPDGVALWIGDVGAVVLQEVGLVADSGATYFSFSGGIIVDLATFDGGLVVKRARFRLTDHPSAPFFKLDGIFAILKMPRIEIEAGGYFTDTTIDDKRVQEFGLAGRIKLDFPVIKMEIALDLMIGEVTSQTERFKYFMFQVAMEGAIPVWSFELRSIRVLFARNVIPKLSQFDAKSGDMRYFNWYRSTDPLKVSGDRRLAAWRPTDDAIAAGLGCGVGITCLSSVAQIRGFLMITVSDPETGLLFTLELMLGISKDPVAYAVLELDFQNDRYSVLFGADLQIKTLVPVVPDWLNKIGRVTGTIFITNKPGTFAMGRIKDPRTWLSVVFDLDLFVFKTFFHLGIGIEFVEDGPKGAGFILTIEGGINPGVIRITYFASIGFVMSNFQTGSADFGLAAFAEAGIRAVLFGFLRFGLGIRAEIRHVGFTPARTEMSIIIRFETPWFLPDITFKLEHTRGRLAPAELATATSPLRSATAQQSLTNRSVPVHATRFDAGWDGNGPTRTYSVMEMRAGAAPEGARLTAFANDNVVTPIATDSTVAIEFSMAINDKLNIAPGGTGSFGRQVAEDLSLEYELVSWTIRRRPRFVPNAVWTVVDSASAQTIDFSDPNNLKLTGTVGPQVFTLFWDMDIRIEGQTAARKLLINASTPFSFRSINPEADEQEVSANPNWPCCPPPRHEKFVEYFHTINFWNDVPGAPIRPGRVFSDSASLFIPEQRALARPRRVGAVLPPNAVIAGFDRLAPGPLFRAELDNDAIICRVQVAWFGVVPGRLELVAFDKFGQLAGSVTRVFNSLNDQQNIRLVGSRPIRRFELHLVAPGTAEWNNFLVLPMLAAGRVQQMVEVAEAAYVRLADYVDQWSVDERCKSGSDRFETAYEGKGKLFFLPNHEYEIAVTTRVATRHKTAEPEAASLTEYAYFATKGLPGLNAATRIGEEIEPYVARAYTGTKGLIYRDEPVTLAFKEDFHVAVPIAVRPAGAGAEHSQFFRMVMTVRPELAGVGTTTYTTASEDWIVANRKAPAFQQVVWVATLAKSEQIHTAMVSVDKALTRLATLTQRPDASCPLADPRDVIGPILIAGPQGPADPANPGQPLWPASTRYSATVRAEASAFVDRPSFVSEDKTAFDFATLGAVATGANWSVSDGILRLARAADWEFAIFGDANWDHISANLVVSVAAGPAGFAIGLPSAIPSQALMAVAEPDGGGVKLTIYRRDAGGAVVPMATQAVADTGQNAVLLRIDGFDDRLRLTCGETAIEVNRGNIRAGRVALTGRGTVDFRSVEVAGLALYEFPFGVSRYRSFESHIGSFGGTVRRLTKDIMGPGTTTATVAELITETHASISDAMTSSGTDAARDALFGRWTTALALPLTQEVVGLTLSAYAEAAATDLVFLEGPEPLDFADPVSAVLERRVRIRRPIPWQIGYIEGIRDALFMDKVKSDIGALETQLTVPDSMILEANRLSLPPQNANIANRARILTRRASLSGISRKATEIRVDFSEMNFQLNRDVAVVSIKEINGSNASIETFDCAVGRKANGQAFAKGRRNREMVLDLGTPVEVADLDTLSGAVIVIDPQTGGILDWIIPTFSYQPVSVSILQDGSACRCLIIPAQGATAAPLPSGHYRLTFAINRQRWDTTDVTETRAKYTRTAAIEFDL